MTHFKLDRRTFIKGSGALALGAATGLGFAPGAGAGNGGKTLVYIFLRGAMDGLSFMPPTSGMDRSFYEDARDRTLLGTSSDNMPLSLGAGFGLHPACTDLHDLFQSNELAIVHACGHPPGTQTRSHFDAQEQIELGTPGEQAFTEGWLSRYLNTSALPADPLFSALAASSNPPISLNGFSQVATLDSAGSFSPNSGHFENTHLLMLQKLYAGQGGLDLAAQSALEAISVINALNLDDYPQASLYENTSVGRNLRFVAQLLSDPPDDQGIPQDLGISVATVDVGGWDDHNNLYPSFFNRVRDLSRALAAFHADLKGKGLLNDVAVIVQSEFGRQVKENANRGTDHGLGVPMVVMGGGVNGGVYGTFPGLAPAQRISDSVEPTTDFRRVLATVVDQMLGNPNVDQIFPGYNTYTPMGFA